MNVNAKDSVAVAGVTVRYTPALASNFSQDKLI